MRRSGEKVTLLLFGAEVVGDEGSLGLLRGLEFTTPGMMLVTLVVEPAHRLGMGRAVPVSTLVVVDKQIKVSLTNAEFAASPASESKTVSRGLDVGYTILSEHPAMVKVESQFVEHPGQRVVSEQTPIQWDRVPSGAHLQGCTVDDRPALAGIHVIVKGLWTHRVFDVQSSSFELQGDSFVVDGVTNV